MSNRLKQAYDLAKTGYDVWQAHGDTVRAMGEQGMRAAQYMQEQGGIGAITRGAGDHVRQAAGNPEVQQAVGRVVCEMGGAAARGALESTGVIEDGSFSILGATKAAVGLKTGTTYAKAARGAVQGMKQEGKSQWSSGALSEGVQVFMPTASFNAASVNPFQAPPSFTTRPAYEEDSFARSQPGAPLDNPFVASSQSMASSRPEPGYNPFQR